MAPPSTASLPKTAVVHEWLTEWGGSEDVTRAMLSCLPGAELYATIDFLNDTSRHRLGASRIHTTFLQRMPGARTRFWHYLPLTPLAVEGHDLRDAELVVSSSHAFAKGVLTTAEQLHISYVHSPMRYAWDLHFQYLQDYGLDHGLKGLLARWMFHRLRQWDRQTANNVDLFLANSHHVRRRIWRTYRRPAVVLFPPVDVERFTPGTDRDDVYLTVSRLVSYKRVDLIVEAFRAMPKRRLIVIGDGPEAARLRERCPPNVSLMGWQPDDVVQRHMATARAFVFAAQEDFGISPVEAQACGTPVIAYGVGGSAETVRGLGHHEQPTGVWFMEQSVAALIDAVETFESESSRFDSKECRAWAETFGLARFRSEFVALLKLAMAESQWNPANLDRLAERTVVQE